MEKEKYQQQTPQHRPNLGNLRPRNGHYTIGY